MTKYSLVFLLIAAVFVCSCKKTVLTGSGLLPKGDNINGTYTDTLTLLTKTSRENRLFTNGNTTFLLGSMVDPVFGNSNASIFTQLGLPDPNPSFTGCTLDSVVLCLVYAGKYGDLKTVPQSVNVYQLTGSGGIMNVDSPYYSDRVFTYNPAKLGGKQNFYPDFSTQPVVYANGAFDTLPPMLRIRLSNSFGQSMLNADSANFTNLENLQAYIQGLLIAPDTTRPGKGIMYFNLGDGNSSLTLYYHNATTPSQSYTFLLSGDCARSNLFHHNYINSIAGKAINSTAASDSIVYAQAMAGLRTKINVPYLPSNILVNKAEITITQVLDQATDDTVFHVPNQMFVLADSAQIDQLTPDLLTNAPLSYGGLKSSFVNSMGQTVVSYKFSVTDVLQEMVANLKTYPKQKNYAGLYLITATSTDVADRFVLGGGNSKSVKMKLTLVYTKLP